ncbi:TetR/AcrR family transcriptional regulator [soil metagenome]
MASDAPPGTEDARLRIIEAGAEILAKSGRDALTTRAVASLSGMQAPTIYRLFGDKQGLLEAVAEYAMQKFVAEKGARAMRDPIDDLRLGWDLNVAFGLAHPAIFSIMSVDPAPGHVSPAAAAGLAILHAKVERLAKRGLLRVSVERAVNLIRASGTGTIITLLGMPEGKRDMGLSATALEGVLAVITRATPAVEHPGAAGAAIALRASLGHADALTPGERMLLDELLARLAPG